MRTFSNQRGISLVEVLASVTLFAIGAAGLSAGTVANIRGNSASRAASAASALAHDRIERFRALDPSTNPAALTPGTHQDALNPMDGLGRAGGAFTRSWTVTADTPRKGLSQVVVTVSWHDPIPRSITGVTFVCRTVTCS
jgi:Tfp pilus assembly protein PilV